MDFHQADGTSRDVVRLHLSLLSLWQRSNSVTVIGSAVPDVDCPGVDGLEVTVGLSDSSRGDTLDGRDWGERLQARSWRSKVLSNTTTSITSHDNTVSFPQHVGIESDSLGVGSLGASWDLVSEGVDCQPRVAGLTHGTTGDEVGNNRVSFVVFDFSLREELSHGVVGVVLSDTHPDGGVIEDNLALISSALNNRLDLELSEARTGRRERLSETGTGRGVHVEGTVSLHDWLGEFTKTPSCNVVGAWAVWEEHGLGVDGVLEGLHVLGREGGSSWTRFTWGSSSSRGRQSSSFE